MPLLLQIITPCAHLTEGCILMNLNFHINLDVQGQFSPVSPTYYMNSHLYMKTTSFMKICKSNQIEKNQGLQSSGCYMEVDIIYFVILNLIHGQVRLYKRNKNTCKNLERERENHGYPSTGIFLYFQILATYFWLDLYVLTDFFSYL